MSDVKKAPLPPKPSAEEKKATNKKNTPPKQNQSKAETTAAVKDAKATKQKGPNGETIYEGPRTGKFYINKNGNKTYVK